ncbi:response regulator [Aromatoleum toluclasticum]|nr:response regulator transcription factor [Aromatoleum toluclasticum]
MLIVEDQETMRQKLREYLQAEFPDRVIREAASGSEALARCREVAPQIVLMDIGLPDIDGITLTAEIKRMLPATAIVVVSSYAGPEYPRRAAKAGADAYINKMDITRALLPAVLEILARGGPAPLPQDGS